MHRLLRRPPPPLTLPPLPVAPPAPAVHLAWGIVEAGDIGEAQRTDRHRRTAWGGPRSRTLPPSRSRGRCRKRSQSQDQNQRLDPSPPRDGLDGRARAGSRAAASPGVAGSRIMGDMRWPKPGRGLDHGTRRPPRAGRAAVRRSVTGSRGSPSALWDGGLKPLDIFICDVYYQPLGRRRPKLSIGHGCLNHGVAFG